MVGSVGYLIYVQAQNRGFLDRYNKVMYICLINMMLIVSAKDKHLSHIVIHCVYFLVKIKPLLRQKYMSWSYVNTQNKQALLSTSM